MKNSSIATKLVTVFIAVAVLAYFGVQAWRYFTDPGQAAAVYVYRAEHTLALNGYVVRDESVVDCSERLVELTRDEGERVARGKPLAVAYQSAQALESARELTAMEGQLEQLRYAQSAARDTEAALRLDTEIEEDIIALHTALAAMDYVALDARASALRTVVLRREFAYRGNADLSGRIETLEGRIAAASAALGGSSQVIEAPFAGTYSAVADGYETVLTPKALETMTPAIFDRLAPERVSSTVGKLIRGSRWYYAAALDEADAAQLREGKTYQLALAGVGDPLPVTVLSVSGAQEGRCLAVFCGDEYLSRVTMLREQSAELILESYSGLRVPKNALRIGEDGRLGVYCRVGLIAYFKPVELVYQGEDYCLVCPGDVEAARESDVVLYTLRAGDEVLIAAGGLHNGKVVG